MDDPDINPWRRTPEYLAIGGYFSPGEDGGAPNIRDLWRAALADLPNSEYPQHLANSIDAGMKLIIYEGGQHYTDQPIQEAYRYRALRDWVLGVETEIVDILVPDDE